MGKSECPLCPICKTECDITEEDLIDADCGACGPVTIHVHCKEKYCRQKGMRACFTNMQFWVRTQIRQHVPHASILHLKAAQQASKS